RAVSDRIHCCETEHVASSEPHPIRFDRSRSAAGTACVGPARSSQPSACPYPVILRRTRAISLLVSTGGVPVCTSANDPSMVMKTIWPAVIASEGTLVGVINEPPSWRTLTLPDVPWLMPSAFMRRYASMMACRWSVSSLVIAAGAFLNPALNPFDDDEHTDVIGREVGLVNASRPHCIHRRFGPGRNTR